MTSRSPASCQVQSSQPRSREVLPILEPDAARLEVVGSGRDPNGSGQVAMLPQGRLRTAIGRDDAVAAEVEVVGRVAEIAAIGPCRLARPFGPALLDP